MAKNTTPKDKLTQKTVKKASKNEEVPTIAGLQEELKTLRNDHQESRRSHRLGELVNPHVLTTQRKKIARTLTQIKQLETAEKATKLANKEEN